ncbi:cytochrome-c peroxidase [Aliidiomarina celeris]|uniref:cytochrome-c peroxidase n=1 Tax=Aliidiomarina celeris TaxID=2249428 RepID=UPI000DE90204|nr:cytochrome c peroxidase [Aliidiomarina celeris]
MKLSSVDFRTLVGVALLLLANTVGLAPLGATEHASDYLRPQSEWPALHINAHADVAPLPEALDYNALLAEIGAQLFHDTQLSIDNSVSCASCHNASLHFADSVRVSRGVEGREGHRTAQILRFAGHWQSLFWDGRVTNLEQLVGVPLTDPNEMDSSIEHVMSYVGSTAYKAQLEAYFDSPLVWQHVASAIAEFMRSIESPKRQFDYFMEAIAAGDFNEAETHLNAQQREGLHLFRTRAGCVQCHAGALFSDQKMHNIGLAYYGRKFEDLGHFQVSGDPQHVGAFRTPTLRYVSEREHLMHNGLFTDLLGIIRMYRHGGARPKPRPAQIDDPLFPTTSPLLQPFALTAEEEQALLAFLKTL